MVTKALNKSLLTSSIVVVAWLCQGAETEPKQKEGLKRIQLVTDATAVTPGEPITVGLILDPEEGYHTYWKGPGIVGVATTFEWTLPEGFTAGEVIWPPPGKTDMAGINAHGYRSETCLLTEIETPSTIPEDEVTILVKCAWMACATSCHPGLENFSLTLPVNHSHVPSPADENYRERFQNIRDSEPPSAPDDWKMTPRLVNPETIELDVIIPGLDRIDAEEFYFFSYDMQVDSNSPQQVSFTGDLNSTLRFRLTRPDFAPANPEALSGVLFHPEGWPGLHSNWIEITAPWPSDTFEK